MEVLLVPDSAVARIYRAAEEFWPEHKTFLARSLGCHSPTELGQLELLAARILDLAGADLVQYLDSYRWVCRALNEEQIAFVRSGTYRHSRFADVQREIYSNAPFMRKYMEGLLISQMFWANHAKSFLSFQDFIHSLKSDFRYLEIGPGHGLFLALVAQSPHAKAVEAWDVSNESLAQTAACLRKMSINREVELRNRDVAMADGCATPKFDVITISEVLEHLEDPSGALKNLRRQLAAGGKIFVNFPINSPAPDHIYYLDSLAAVESLVIDAGMQVASSFAFPATGYDMRRAASARATVSCVVIAVNPAG